MKGTNSKFINYVKTKPLVYEESSNAFWDDEHISKYMLEAHLNPDCDSASRKQDSIVKSVNWIESYCGGGKGKKLLDLGCGPGIYAELLTEKGFCVTGIDFSERSINHAIQSARQKQKEIEYHYQNYLEINYKEEFDVVILIYCDLGVLPPKSREMLLKKIYQALKVGGILILDVFHEPYLNSFQEKQSVNYEKSGFWSPDPYVVIQRNLYYKETANTLEQYLIVTENKCECYNIWNQIYSKGILFNEIREGGFKNIEFFDNIRGTEFTGQETTISIVAQK